MSATPRGPRTTPMRQTDNLGDDRNKGFCVHCGGPDGTDDHNPSKAFLDAPLPANLPVVSSCRPCNNGFSLDEEYLACLLECVVSGRVEPERFERPSVARALANNRRLQRELEAARREDEGQLHWQPDQARVKRIVLKLARGHAAFELNEPRLDDPEVTSIRPLMTMSQAELRDFEGQPGEMALWPEVGSRAFNRLFEAYDDTYDNGWIVVQQDRYRYRTSQDAGLSVRIVLREYLACEVVWA